MPPEGVPARQTLPCSPSTTMRLCSLRVLAPAKPAAGHVSNRAPAGPEPDIRDGKDEADGGGPEEEGLVFTFEQPEQQWLASILGNLYNYSEEVGCTKLHVVPVPSRRGVQLCVPPCACCRPGLHVQVVERWNVARPLPGALQRSPSPAQPRMRHRPGQGQPWR